MIALAHKTLTISEEAYKALKSLKKAHESFTEVILRITAGKKDNKELLDWIKKQEGLADLADSIEEAYGQRNEVSLRY